MQNEHITQTVAEFITSRLRLCRKSAGEIAQEMGYPNANLISMIADGKAKLPLKDIKKLAVALDIDPAYLLLVVLADYMPETLGVIEDIVGSPLLSHNERKLVESYRRVTQGKDAHAVVCDAREIVALVMV